MPRRTSLADRSEAPNSPGGLPCCDYLARRTEPRLPWVIRGFAMHDAPRPVRLPPPWRYSWLCRGMNKWCPEELSGHPPKRLISQSNHTLEKSPKPPIARSGFVEKGGREWTWRFECAEQRPLALGTGRQCDGSKLTALEVPKVGVNFRQMPSPLAREASSD